MLPSPGTWTSNPTKLPMVGGNTDLPILVNRTLANTCVGPVDVNVSDGDLTKRVWGIKIDDGEFIAILRTADETGWEKEVSLFTTTGDCLYPSLTFDQLGKPLVTFMRGGHGWLWWFNPITATNEVRDMGAVDSITIAIDYPYANLSAETDVTVFTLSAGALSYRIQRDRYDVIYDGNADLPGAILFGGGLRSDNTFRLLYGVPVVS